MTLEGHAEVLKLERLLDAAPGRLAYLERLDAADVRLLRERATVSLYDQDRRFARVALASRIPPAQLTAWIAQHLFGALLCARVTGLLETRRAVDLAERMPAEFLADLACQLDPRRARDIILALPPWLIGEVAAVLCRREEYIAMGRFVGHMTDAALLAAFRVIDDASLLRISYFVEQKEQLDHVVGLLSPARIRGSLRAATGAGLWPQAFDLLTRVGDRRRGELADLTAQEDERVLEGLVRAAQREGLWEVVLPVARHMSDEPRRRFARVPALHEPPVLEAVLDAAVACDLLADLLPLASLLPPAARRVIADRAPQALRRAIP